METVETHLSSHSETKSATKEASKSDSEYNKQDGCGVDWSWLEGRKVASAVNDLKTMTFTFEDGQTFKLQALMYKGEAFLAFTPYQDPTKDPAKDEDEN